MSRMGIHTKKSPYAAVVQALPGTLFYVLCAKNATRIETGVKRLQKMENNGMKTIKETLRQVPLACPECDMWEPLYRTADYKQGPYGDWTLEYIGTDVDCTECDWCGDITQLRPSIKQ